MKSTTLLNYGRGVLRDPSETETAGAGGDETPPAKAEEGLAPIQEDNHLQQTEKLDWSKVEGQDLSLEAFRGQELPKAEEKKDDGGKTGEEKEEETQTEVAEVKEETETSQEVSVTGEIAQQPKAEEDPLTKRFPEHKVFLKKMPKEAGEYLNARLRDVIAKENELKEATEALTLAQQGKVKIPDNYYDNPNAVVLTPDFQQNSFNVGLAGKISDLWNAQYERILNGEEWQPVEEVVDPKTGALVDVRLGKEKYEANGTAQAQVGRYVRQADTQLERLQAQQQSLIQNFHQQTTARVAKIKEAENNFFPPDKYEKKGSPEFELTQGVMQGLNNIGLSPSNPAYGMLAKAGATILQLREYIIHMDKKNGKVATVAAKAKKASPTGGSTASGGATELKEEEDTMKAFNQLLIHKH